MSLLHLSLDNAVNGEGSGSRHGRFALLRRCWARPIEAVDRRQHRNARVVSRIKRSDPFGVMVRLRLGDGGRGESAGIARGKSRARRAGHCTISMPPRSCGGENHLKVSNEE